MGSVRWRQNRQAPSSWWTDDSGPVLFVLLVSLAVMLMRVRLQRCCSLLWMDGNSPLSVAHRRISHCFLTEMLWLLFPCTEAEHGYASVLPLSPDHSDKRSKQKAKKMSAGGNRWEHYITDSRVWLWSLSTSVDEVLGETAHKLSVSAAKPPVCFCHRRSVHNELEKNR